MQDRLKKEEEYETELILYPYEDCYHHSPHNRLRIECAPDLSKIPRDSRTVEYGGVVPGRQNFPEDKDIPLRTYDEKTKTLSSIRAQVKITFQTTIRTGTGKITNIEYKITRIT